MSALHVLNCTTRKLQHVTSINVYFVANDYMKDAPFIKYVDGLWTTIISVNKQNH